MLFGRYHIVIFQESRGATRRLKCRGWVLVAIGVLLVGLLAGDFVLLKNVAFGDGASGSGGASGSNQKSQMLTLSRKLLTLQNDVARIRDFDSKLRVMINLGQGAGATTAPEGGSGENLARGGFLPVYREELLARKMNEFLRQLSAEARLEEVSQQEIIQRLRANLNVLESTPSVWPASGWVTSGFGWRVSPFTGQREFHKGLDISAPVGTAVHAPARGVVELVKADPSYGLMVDISHGAGLSTRYAHLQRAAVREGQTVRRGDVIAYIGDSGRSTGPHLHYEVRVSGMPVNPLRYILN